MSAFVTLPNDLDNPITRAGQMVTVDTTGITDLARVAWCQGCPRSSHCVASASAALDGPAGLVVQEINKQARR